MKGRLENQIKIEASIKNMLSDKDEIFSGKNTFENICYAFNKGFISCYFTINIFEKWSIENRAVLEKEIKKFVLAYINSFVNNKDFINLTPFSNMIELIIKNELGILDNTVNMYKCGLGN